jgi:putative ABC transport system ATP-binding protein
LKPKPQPDGPNHPSDGKNPAVKVTGLVKGFGRGAARTEVLQGVDLAAPFGELFYIVGPSGCGKTTLLTLIAGLLDAEKGEVTVFGRRLSEMSDAQKAAFRRENLGFIFQQFNLLPTLTAAENAAVPLLIQKQPRKRAVEQAEELLCSVGLSHRLRAYPGSLSGGEQQRVAIARALAAKPRLLICDEPTASLDGDTGLKVMETLRKTALQKDRCIIMVTHDSRIFSFADTIARMLDGRIVSVEKNRTTQADGPMELI